jgi:DNA-binding CsgD family transcriptional regulator
MVAYIVTPSALVAGALTNSIESHFDKVLKFSDLDQIKSNFEDAKVIVYDMNLSRAEAAALLRFGADHDGLLRKLVVMTREGVEFADLFPLIGATGAVLPPHSTAEEIALAARVVQAGLSVLPMEVLLHWRVANIDSSNPEIVAQFGFTQREMEVLDLLGRGQSNKMIARDLKINDTTVRVYVRSILQKLGVQNRTQAALFFSGRNNFHGARQSTAEAFRGDDR